MWSSCDHRVIIESPNQRCKFSANDQLGSWTIDTCEPRRGPPGRRPRRLDDWMRSNCLSSPQKLARISMGEASILSEKLKRLGKNHQKSSKKHQKSYRFIQSQLKSKWNQLKIGRKLDQKFFWKKIWCQKNLQVWSCWSWHHSGFPGDHSLFRGSNDDFGGMLKRRETTHTNYNQKPMVCLADPFVS